MEPVYFIKRLFTSVFHSPLTRRVQKNGNRWVLAALYKREVTELKKLSEIDLEEKKNVEKLGI